jgi:hypothetical protein
MRVQQGVKELTGEPSPRDDGPEAGRLWKGDGHRNPLAGVQVDGTMLVIMLRQPSSGFQQKGNLVRENSSDPARVGQHEDRFMRPNEHKRAQAENRGSVQSRLLFA